MPPARHAGVLYEIDADVKTQDAADGLLIEQLAAVGMVLMSLWSVKDHAGYTELGFLIWQTPTGPVLNRNLLGMPTTTASGSREFVEFARDDIHLARLDRLTATVPLVRARPQSTKGITRLASAHYFVQGALVPTRDA